MIPSILGYVPQSIELFRTHCPQV